MLAIVHTATSWLPGACSLQCAVSISESPSQRRNRPVAAICHPCGDDSWPADELARLAPAIQQAASNNRLQGGGGGSFHPLHAKGAFRRKRPLGRRGLCFTARGVPREETGRIKLSNRLARRKSLRNRHLANGRRASGNRFDDCSRPMAANRRAALNASLRDRTRPNFPNPYRTRLTSPLG